MITVTKVMLVYTMLVGSEPRNFVEFFDTQEACLAESEAIGPLVEWSECWTLIERG